MTLLQRLIWLLAGLFVIDRLLKQLAIENFIRHSPRPAGRASIPLPSVSLIQPITVGASGLAVNLRARGRLEYAGAVEHILICDSEDRTTRDVVEEFRECNPGASCQVVIVASPGGRPATKIEKLKAGTERATGEIVVCVDDDVRLRPDALLHLVPPLGDPAAGATFGVACYIGWSTLWTSAMSAFVNLNALTSYLPLTFLIEPFTVTGHCFAVRRETFEEVGGFSGMTGRIDDDHELARRLRAHGYRLVQTALIYDVVNELPTLGAFLNQMHRWFLFPRQAVAPFLTRRETVATTSASVAGLILPLLAVAALFGRRSATTSLALCLAFTFAGQVWNERRHLNLATPMPGWPVLLVMAVVGPVLVVASLLRGDVIAWRGQRIRVRRGGWFEVVT